MGNCSSTASHRRAAADTLAGDTMMWKERSTTDYMDLQNESDENTLPMSTPGSTLLSDASPLPMTPSPLPASSFESPSLVPCQTPVVDLPNVPVYTPKRVSPTQQTIHAVCESSQLCTPAPAARLGKALQHRLEKARSVQSALSKSTSNAGDNDEESDDEVCLLSSITSSHSVSSKNSHHLMSTSKKLNDEFEASISKGMIWAEAELGDTVACIAISRRAATVTIDSPALYMAVGTKTGTIVIFELLEESPMTANRTVPEEGTSDGNDDGSVSLEEILQDRLHQSTFRRLRIAVSIRHKGGRIRSLDFSPDGLFLALGGDDCSCTLYTLLYASHKAVDNNEDMLVNAELYGEIQRVDRVYCVQFSPDGRYLAVGGFDGTVAIVLQDDLLSSHMPDVTVEIPRDGLIYTLDWSPDSRYLAIGGSDKCCAIVDTQTSWNVMKEIRRSTPVADVKWYPTDGTYLAIASANIAIVDRLTYAVKHEFEVPGTNMKPCRVNALCWSPNGTYIVVCDSGSRCTLFETRSFAQVYEINRSKAITSVVWGQQIATTGNLRRYLAIGGEDDKVVIVKAGLELNAGASSAADDLSSSSSSLLSQRGDWSLKESAFRDVDDVPHVASKARAGGELSNGLSVTAIAFSRGSKSRPSTFFAYCLDDGLVVVRSTIDFRIIAELRFSKPMKSLAFSNGSRFLAMGGADGRAFVVETAPSWLVVTQPDFDSPIQTLAYSKHNERLAVGLKDGVLALLDAQASYDICGDISGNDSPVSAIDWTSKNFALGRLDGTVAIYESEHILTNAGSPIAVLQQTSPIRSIAFGASGRFLAIGGIDGNVNVYSAKGGWIRCHGTCVPPGLHSIAWSATGRFLAIAGDRYLRVMDTIFWTEFPEASLALLPGDLSRTISSLAFSQDESMLAVSVIGNGVRIIDCKLWKLLFIMNKAESVEATSDE